MPSGYCWLADCYLSHAILCLLLQGHGAEVKQLKGLIAQKNKDFSAGQGHLDSLKKQLAEASALVSSLTSDLGASQQSHHNAFQVLLLL